MNGIRICPNLLMLRMIVRSDRIVNELGEFAAPAADFDVMSFNFETMTPHCENVVQMLKNIVRTKGDHMKFANGSFVCIAAGETSEECSENFNGLLKKHPEKFEKPAA